MEEIFSKRLTHVNIALQWVREMILYNAMTLEFIHTNKQAADFLTTTATQVMLP